VGSSAIRLAIGTWISMFALLIATWISLRWIDGLRWDFVRLDARAARPELLTSGALIGALAIGVPSVLLLVTNELRVVPAPAGSWGAMALQSALLLLPAAFFEELALRGYIFSVLRETIGWKWALIATSVVFGLLHTSNPGADPEAILIVVIAGFFLGTIVIVTDSLYAAWMAHFAWNWTMAAGLHTAVSGLGLPTPNYRSWTTVPTGSRAGRGAPKGAPRRRSACSHFSSTCTAGTSADWSDARWLIGSP
jgi:membrane protease YdiL (CAAX protease family)